MKALKKLTLATAIAAAPFMAQAELKMIDDESLSTMTGQAGVTIETTALVNIGQVAYVDENTAESAAGAADGNYGVVAIDGISLSDNTGGAVAITQTIDVNSDGELEIGVSGISNLRLQVNNMTIGSSASPGATGSAITGLTQGTGVGAAASESMGAVRVDVGNVGAITQTITTGGATGQGLTIGMGNTSITDVDIAYVDGGFDNNTGNGLTAGSNAAVIGGMDITMTGATQNIDVVDDAGTAKLQITNGASTINLGIESIAMATETQFEAGNTGASIGSVYVTGINMAGTTTRIYGH